MSRTLTPLAVPVEPSGYVTDGVRLFRVVAPMDPVLGITSAVLEDCITLGWGVYHARDLHRLGLRGVHRADRRP